MACGTITELTGGGVGHRVRLVVSDAIPGAKLGSVASTVSGMVPCSTGGAVGRGVPARLYLPVSRPRLSAG